MKIVAIACNIVLLGFTVLVSLTDGPAREAPYVVFGVLLILVPVLNVVTISRRRPRHVAIVANVVLLGYSVFALIDQLPHPQEAGFLEYAILVVLTPVLSALVIALAKGRPEKAERPPVTA